MSALLGCVKNGVVIFDGGFTLPEGTAVRIEPLQAADQAARLQKQLLDWAGKGVDLPPDLARRHDQYLHQQEE
jgi:hypothetical protein